MPSPPRKSPPGTVPVAQLANLLMLTTHRVRQLVVEGHIPPPVARDAYPLVGSIQGYLRFRRDDSQRVAKAHAASALNDARVKEIEQRIAARDARLVDIDELDEVTTEVVDLLEREMAALPTKIDDPVVRERAVLAMQEIFTGTKADLAATIARLRATGKAS